MFNNDLRRLRAGLALAEGTLWIFSHTHGECTLVLIVFESVDHRLVLFAIS
jgi:hypothetical protein